VSFCGVTSSELEKAVLDPTKFDQLMEQISLREALISEISRMFELTNQYNHIESGQSVSCLNDRHRHVHIESIMTLSGNWMSVRGNRHGLLVFSTRDEEMMYQLMQNDTGTRDISTLLQRHPEVRFISDRFVVTNDEEQLSDMTSSLAREICTDERGVCWNALALELCRLFRRHTDVIPIDIAEHITKFNAFVLFNKIKDMFPTSLSWIIAEYAVVDDFQHKILCGFGCEH